MVQCAASPNRHRCSTEWGHLEHTEIHSRCPDSGKGPPLLTTGRENLGPPGNGKRAAWRVDDNLQA